MRLRERQHDERERPAPVGGAPGPSTSIRDQAEFLLAQGADAIDRALSGDSAAFLAANRQEGGQ